MKRKEAATRWLGVSSDDGLKSATGFLIQKPTPLLGGAEAHHGGAGKARGRKKGQFVLDGLKGDQLLGPSDPNAIASTARGVAGHTVVLEHARDERVVNGFAPKKIRFQADLSIGV